MLERYIEKAIERIPGLEERGNQLSRSIHQAVLEGGEPARKVADLLHGTWIEHPLHPIMTDIVIGAWTLGLMFDGVAAAKGSEQAGETADALTAIGVAAAVPTALAGLADYSTVPQWATRTATLHAFVNNVALMVYGLSLWQRQRGRRGVGVALSLLAYSAMGVGGWLGGHMVYKQRVGVNHTPEELRPETWTPVLGADELHEGQRLRVEVEDSAILLYRKGGTIYASSAICPHAGGPLEAGKFDGFCVECPWHQSVFDLRDGTLVHGPSTYTLPRYAARIHDGHIEVRLREEGYQPH